MNQNITPYASVLYSLSPEPAEVDAVEAMLASCPLVEETLCNPLVTEKEKFSCIEKIFSPSLHTFLKLVCRHEKFGCISEIFSEYREIARQAADVAHAVLEYVTPLTQTQLTAMRKKICEKTGKPAVQLELKKNPALLGGFVLQIGDDTYDRSRRRALIEMRKSLIRR